MSGIDLPVAIDLLAYIGPGLGAGTLVLLFGFAGSIFLALFAVVWYPVRRVMRMLRTWGAPPRAPVSTKVVIVEPGLATVETVEQ